MSESEKTIDERVRERRAEIAASPSRVWHMAFMRWSSKWLNGEDRTAQSADLVAMGFQERAADAEAQSNVLSEAARLVWDAEDEA